MPLLTLKNISISFDKFLAVSHVSMSLEEGEIACLLGPSGCGKTTLLRAIAGFEGITEGEIVLGGELVTDNCTLTPPEKRHIGMVFQDFALFPHLSVRDNIRFGIRHLKRKEQKQRIDELLLLIGLQGLDKRFPHELSGGQQQRIALARALAPKPHLLLMDEPFSSMDVELRETLAREVRDILKHENITAILVTHDQDEAFAMADTIGVMKEGELEQWATGYSLYHQPTTPFVADFIGQGVLIDGIVREDNVIETSFATLYGKVPQGCKTGSPVQVLIRPDDIVYDENSPRKAKIVARNFQGANYLYTLELKSGTRLLSLVNSHHDHAVGEMLGITLDIDHLVIFVGDEGL